MRLVLGSPLNVLHVDSSINGEESISRQLTCRIVESLRQLEPTAIIRYRDLAKNPLPHLTFTAKAKAAHAASLNEFLAADVVVIGAPMYNFGIPSQLKAWIDSITVARRTFRMREDGSEGLTRDKRVIVASSRGGAYSEQMADLDFQETYLRTVFRFLGIDVEIVRAEGLGRTDLRQNAIERAFAHADTLCRLDAARSIDR